MRQEEDDDAPVEGQIFPMVSETLLIAWLVWTDFPVKAEYC